MDNTAASVKAFSRKQRCGLGAVEFGRRLLPFLTASGMMSYMLEGMEVSGSGVWMIMMAALIVSSLTVFILSFVMDRTRKRSGRSKPWIYSGIFLLAVSVLMSMHVPGNAMGARLVYAEIVIFVWSSSVKLLLYPADALIAGMTADAAERWNLASVKGIAGSLAAICAVFPAGRLAAPGIMGADGGKRYVTVFTVLIIIAILTGSFLLKEINIPRIPESQSMSLKNCAGDFKAFLTNRYFLILVVYGGLLMFGTSYRGIFFLDFKRNRKRCSYEWDSLWNPPGCVFCRTASEQETYQKTVCPFGNRNLCSGLLADACEYENTARLLSGVCIGRNRKRIYVGNAVGHGTGCVRSCGLHDRKSARRISGSIYRRCCIDRGRFGRCSETEFGRVYHESAEFFRISGGIYTARWPETVGGAGIYGDTFGGLRSGGVGAEEVWAG